MTDMSDSYYYGLEKETCIGLFTLQCCQLVKLIRLSSEVDHSMYIM